MQRIKIILLWVFKLLGLFALSRWLTRHCFTIVGWHGVSFVDEHERLPAYFISAETLQGRLAHLSRHFRIVPLAELVRQHAAGQIAARQVALTFDDGMYNFSARALPVLREFAAPATVYVVSGTMQRRNATCVLLIQDIVYRTKCTALPQGVCGMKKSYSLEGFAARRACLNSLTQAISKLPNDPDVRERFVRELAENLAIDLREDMEGDMWRYMLAPEIRELSDAGISMQLHSHRHLSVVHNPDTVFEEARTCRKLLEQVTDRLAEDYCYPSGYWDQAAWGPLCEAGVRSAVTCEIGLNTTRTPPLALRRHVDTQYMSAIEFEFALSGLQWILYSLVGKSTFFKTRESK
jgi:peptidoglycan/xylan/chitin deacetylase (PgdA/CDA1 family)